MIDIMNGDNSNTVAESQRDGIGFDVLEAFGSFEDFQAAQQKEIENAEQERIAVEKELEALEKRRNEAKKREEELKAEKEKYREEDRSGFSGWALKNAGRTAEERQAQIDAAEGERNINDATGKERTRNQFDLYAPTQGQSKEDFQEKVAFRKAKLAELPKDEDGLIDMQKIAEMRETADENYVRMLMGGKELTPKNVMAYEKSLLAGMGKLRKEIAEMRRKREQEKYLTEAQQELELMKEKLDKVRAVKMEVEIPDNGEDEGETNILGEGLMSGAKAGEEETSSDENEEPIKTAPESEKQSESEGVATTEVEETEPRSGETGEEATNTEENATKPEMSEDEAQELAKQLAEEVAAATRTALNLSEVEHKEEEVISESEKKGKILRLCRRNVRSWRRRVKAAIAAAILMTTIVLAACRADKDAARADADATPDEAIVTQAEDDGNGDTQGETESETQEEDETSLLVNLDEGDAEATNDNEAMGESIDSQVDHIYNIINEGRPESEVAEALKKIGVDYRGMFANVDGIGYNLDKVDFESQVGRDYYDKYEAGHQFTQGEAAKEKAKFLVQNARQTETLAQVMLSIQPSVRNLLPASIQNADLAGIEETLESDADAREACLKIVADLFASGGISAHRAGRNDKAAYISGDDLSIEIKSDNIHSVAGTVHENDVIYWLTGTDNKTGGTYMIGWDEACGNVILSTDAQANVPVVVVGEITPPAAEEVEATEPTGDTAVEEEIPESEPEHLPEAVAEPEADSESPAKPEPERVNPEHKPRPKPEEEKEKPEEKPEEKKDEEEKPKEKPEEKEDEEEKKKEEEEEKEKEDEEEKDKPEEKKDEEEEEKKEDKEEDEEEKTEEKQEEPEEKPEEKPEKPAEVPVHKGDETNAGTEVTPTGQTPEPEKGVPQVEATEENRVTGGTTTPGGEAAMPGSQVTTPTAGEAEAGHAPGSSAVAEGLQEIINQQETSNGGTENKNDAETTTTFSPTETQKDVAPEAIEVSGTPTITTETNTTPSRPEYGGETPSNSNQSNAELGAQLGF